MLSDLECVEELLHERKGEYQVSEMDFSAMKASMSKFWETMKAFPESVKTEGGMDATHIELIVDGISTKKIRDGLFGYQSFITMAIDIFGNRDWSLFPVFEKGVRHSMQFTISRVMEIVSGKSRNVLYIYCT
jgi:hypothetical protein